MLKHKVTKVNKFVQGKQEILKTFSVKGYKSWPAREGVGAEATLYKDGKKVGWCTDEGNGGEVELKATSDNLWLVKSFLDTLLKYKFNDYWKEQYGEEWDGSKKSALESWKVFTFADVMLDQAEEEMQLKELCRTKLVVSVEGEKNFGVFNAKWPKNKYAQLMLMSKLTKQLQPKVITEFVNKRFA